jgi:uncharacterized protein with HEPN domain
MRPESAKFLRDMLDAARAIHQYTAIQTVDEYLTNRAIRDAANWNFTVIGEALNQLKKIDEPTAERITDHWKIIGLRNQLIHRYGVIDHRITWDIIQNKLPILINELEQLLAE